MPGKRKPGQRWNNRLLNEAYEKIGEEEVFNLYLTEGTTRKMVARMHEMIDPEDEELQGIVSTYPFYRWLRKGPEINGQSRRDRWDALLDMADELKREDMEAIAENATNETVPVDRLKIQAKKYSLDHRASQKKIESDSKMADGVQMIGGAWLSALREATERTLDASQPEAIEPPQED